MSDATTPRVSSEIEDAYAEIGRTVIETAIQQARPTGGTSAEGDRGNGHAPSSLREQGRPIRCTSHLLHLHARQRG